MSKKRKGSLSRSILSMLAIIIGVLICSASSIAGLDIYCHSDIERWMPIYPDAELLETQENGFFRVRASGITQQVYYSPDSPNDVRRWYIDYRLELTRDDVSAGSTTIASAQETIMNDPDSDGSIIIYYSECAYN